MNHRIKNGSPEEMLAHFGVKGMRWGQRRAQRKEMRRLDKASVARDKEKDNHAIDVARARLKSGAIGSDYKKAKAQYKSQKTVIGKREALKVLNEKHAKLDAEYALANETKHGAERTGSIIATVGVTALASLLGTQLARNQRV